MPCFQGLTGIPYFYLHTHAKLERSGLWVTSVYDHKGGDVQGVGIKGADKPEPEAQSQFLWNAPVICFRRLFVYAMKMIWMVVPDHLGSYLNKDDKGRDRRWMTGRCHGCPGKSSLPHPHLKALQAHTSKMTDQTGVITSGPASFVATCWGCSVERCVRLSVWVDIIRVLVESWP